jgi:uncharacterized caspase-like protein
VLLSCIGALPSHAEKRVALVVGNDRYVNLPADQQLRKAVNDARVVGDALAHLGFEVIRGENLGRPALVDKFEELTARLAPGDTAFFFFAGHGVAIRGGNYILPADVPNVVEPGQDMRLVRASLGESDIVSDLQGRGVRVAVVVLDACRNNPFKKPGVRAVGAERGLARIEPVRGVFTLYSAGIGQTALDRLGDTDSNTNSVFTRVFVPALTRPGLNLRDLADEVRDEVERLAASVKHDQRPAFYDETIGGRVYLAGLPRDEAKPGEPSKPASHQSEAAQAWTVAQNTASITVLEDFIRRFGDSFYATLARARLDELKKSQVPIAASPAQPSPPPTPVAPAAPRPLPSIDPCSGAGDHWRSAEAIGTRAAYEDHLSRFPGCTFAGLARARIGALATRSAPPPPASPPPASAPTPVAPARTFRVLSTVSQGIHNMRTGPGKGHSLVVSIPAGARDVTVGRCRSPDDDSAHPWCQATWRGRTGWISSCCVVDANGLRP